MSTLGFSTPQKTAKCDGSRTSKPGRWAGVCSIQHLGMSPTIRNCAHCFSLAEILLFTSIGFSLKTRTKCDCCECEIRGLMICTTWLSWRVINECLMCVFSPDGLFLIYSSWSDCSKCWIVFIKFLYGSKERYFFIFLSYCFFLNWCTVYKIFILFWKKNLMWLVLNVGLLKLGAGAFF